jgi:Tol biopolymer transport system component
VTSVNAPQDLEKLIARCLRKDPDRRIQHMDDVQLALEELREEFASGKLSVPKSPHVQRARWRVPVAAVVVAVVGGAIWWRNRPHPSAPTPTITRLTSDAGLTTNPALSPDGKLLAYASDRSGEGNLDIYVKQVGGGEPIRLTRDPADDHEPSFSPDGTQIAFRSERDGGGIYVVSALGGPARRIVAGGTRPQFSPDGKWIAYTVGLGSWLFFGGTGQARIYVVSSGGGEPRRLRSDFAGAINPVWAPDSQHLLFLGNRDEKLSRQGEESIDWWVTPLDSGLPVKTGALDATRSANLSGWTQVYRWILPVPAWTHDGEALIFSARSGDTTNLWRIGISPTTWKVIGAPERLTAGPTLELAPSAASTSGGSLRVAFASSAVNSDIWSLAVDTNHGTVTGAPTRLTRETTADFHPDLSPDGQKIAWVSARSGTQEIWIKDLQTGEDAALTASGTDKWEPRFSPDGSKVSFSSYDNKKWTIYLIPTTGGTPQPVCDDCGQANGWSPDGRRLIGNRLEGQSWLVDVASRRKTALVATPLRTEPQGISPDGQLLSFWISGRFNIASLTGDLPVREPGWITVIDDVNTSGGQWSPNGDLLFMTSFRDGFNCIWAQRLDASAKRPINEPFAIFHPHSVRMSLNPDLVKLSIGRDRVLFDMDERTGNIWMAEWKDR